MSGEGASNIYICLECGLNHSFVDHGDCVRWLRSALAEKERELVEVLRENEAKSKNYHALVQEWESMKSSLSQAREALELIALGERHAGEFVTNWSINDARRCAMQALEKIKAISSGGKAEATPGATESEELVQLFEIPEKGEGLWCVTFHGVGVHWGGDFSEAKKFAEYLIDALRGGRK